MAELNKILDCMKEKAEESFKYYAKKENWEAQDLKAAKDAAELYDKLQNIQMNTGIWEDMKKTGDYSFARYPHISYGTGESYARGRDANTGRYVSRGGEWEAHGQSYGNYGGNPHYGTQHNGISTHSVKDQAIQRLESLMDTAESEYERQEIMKMIHTIERQER